MRSIPSSKKHPRNKLVNEAEVTDSSSTSHNLGVSSDDIQESN